MKLKAKKKGFSIVELVVVIAVIAILVAVLIPTFSNIIKKAQKSSDTQLVRNLNTALIVDDEEHNTMYDALKAAEKAGYDVVKINATQTGNEILWDSANDVFCYLDEGTIKYIPETNLKIPQTNLKEVDYWQIIRAESDLAGCEYSSYLAYEASGEIITTKGIDVGDNTGITSVTYDRSTETTTQEVVIRTNGGTLKIDAPIDTVLHYGEVDALNITAVSPSASYHEFGRVTDEIKIVYGRFVVEKGASIPVVQIDDAANVDNITLISKGDQCIAYISDSDKATALAAKSDRFTVTNNEVFVNAVARIGDTYYTDLIEAFSAADGKTIVLLKDISFKDEGLEAKKNNWITVNEGTSVTLDLAGHVLYCKLDLNKTTAMINNKGTLTIDDSSESKTGLIEYKPGTPDASYGYAGNTITNVGKLIINNGTIKNSASSNGACYVIDNNSTNGSTEVEMNGGWLYNYRTSAIRQFCSSNINNNTVTINGGKVEGFGAIWMQNPNKATGNNGRLTINGGEIKTTQKSVVEGTTALEDGNTCIFNTGSESSGYDPSNLYIEINGGLFNENVGVYGSRSHCKITGGTFNGYVEIGSVDASITGGTFLYEEWEAGSDTTNYSNWSGYTDEQAKDYVESLGYTIVSQDTATKTIVYSWEAGNSITEDYASYIAEGYKGVVNGDGTFTVVPQ